jgi:hypothetical protein
LDFPLALMSAEHEEYKIRKLGIVLLFNHVNHR